MTGNSGPRTHSDPLSFSWPVRVYWEDTDAGGVVYHAQYLAFMERARSEWLRDIGLHQHSLKREADVVFVVRAMDVDFRAPARLDDQLSVSVRLLECRGASFVMVQRIERDGALLVEAKVKIAALRASSFRPCPLPDFLSSQLKLLLETP
ncbi:tol-pal system-associated acyl-CoA thioesterase [Thermomonas fusca]|uniref:Tol-pal system-associated acyl-CoA thioesterase n=1 Tax=Thermomonas fusca TaxID=215690 RepID=A0A5R9PI40_9GAMM|nr:tol-pal system-associated acyl-CoA thioesterase [Thermomonas fusca]TLX23155.1 tol-pal system-associated acyl-CoA thioesterase [Thermomonas fusca]